MTSSIVSIVRPRFQDDRALRNALIVSVALHSLVLSWSGFQPVSWFMASPLHVVMRASVVTSISAAPAPRAASTAPKLIFDHPTGVTVPAVRKTYSRVMPAANIEHAVGAQITPTRGDQRTIDPAALRALRTALVRAVAADMPPGAMPGAQATLKLRFDGGQLLGVFLDPASGHPRLDGWLSVQFERAARALVLPAGLANGKFEIELPVEWSD